MRIESRWTTYYIKLRKVSVKCKKVNSATRVYKMYFDSCPFHSQSWKYCCCWWKNQFKNELRSMRTTTFIRGLRRAYLNTKPLNSCIHFRYFVRHVPIHCKMSYEVIFLRTLRFLLMARDITFAQYTWNWPPLVQFRTLWMSFMTFHTFWL